MMWLTLASMQGVAPLTTAIALLIIGLCGQALEMKKICRSLKTDSSTHTMAFLDRRNWKWYAMMAVSLVLFAISFRPIILHTSSTY